MLLADPELVWQHGAVLKAVLVVAEACGDEVGSAGDRQRDDRPWFVTVRSARAHNAAVAGELSLSAARAWAICASTRWSQNSERLGLTVERGSKDWQAKSAWMICEPDGYPGSVSVSAACARVREAAKRSGGLGTFWRFFMRVGYPSRSSSETRYDSTFG